MWADRGTDLVTGLAPDFTLLALVRNPSNRTVTNLNPFSTLIYQTASKTGVINSGSVAAASEAVLTRYSFGLDTNVVADPVTAEVTDRQRASHRESQ